MDGWNRIEISRSAILHNLALFQSIANQPVIPVLKGNAYGYGLEEIAEVLKPASIPYVAVVDYQDALRVRAVSDHQVLVMGECPPEVLAKVHPPGVAFVVQSHAAVEALGKTKRAHKVHLECNTGLNRYGVDPHEVKALAEHILAYENLTLEGVMTHLAYTYSARAVDTTSANDLFDHCVETILSTGASPKYIHVAATAGIVRKEQSKYANCVRLGKGLFGVNPFAGAHPLHGVLQDLRQSLRVISAITRIRQLQPGQRIGYGADHTVDKPMKVGIIPFGHYEGMYSIDSDGGVVRVGKYYASVVDVTMNHMTIDLSSFDNAKIGDEVVIYSDTLNHKNAFHRVRSEFNLSLHPCLCISESIPRIIVA